jgi:hypothetical protein
VLGAGGIAWAKAGRQDSTGKKTKVRIGKARIKILSLKS